MQYLKQFGAPDYRIFRVPHGIDNEMFAGIAAPFQQRRRREQRRGTGSASRRTRSSRSSSASWWNVEASARSRACGSDAGRRRFRVDRRIRPARRRLARRGGEARCRSEGDRIPESDRARRGVCDRRLPGAAERLVGNLGTGRQRSARHRPAPRRQRCGGLRPRPRPRRRDRLRLCAAETSRNWPMRSRRFARARRQATTGLPHAARWPARSISTR